MTKKSALAPSSIHTTAVLLGNFGTLAIEIYFEKI